MQRLNDFIIECVRNTPELYSKNEKIYKSFDKTEAFNAIAAEIIHYYRLQQNVTGNINLKAIIFFPISNMF